MTLITLPNGAVIIDDSGLMPHSMARRMASEGMLPAAIAAELDESLAEVEQWIREGPYETPEQYWLRRYNDGTLNDEDEDE